ncbi:uncharacterized protein BX663DRAFT_548776 [Cokeromyces recurvatus]|uniref:uncharacterized protein n=1 Tax=Cokeromyces recurvatus TaxID=90255 RepID=UPI00221FABAB|nr:uncharacterized protein BX663DRAFT_548776 [Cokeromyces recurvatus]KAI7906617.1 hypothetical protein BX663DRAFT_548776 [Cokeromyces recurvatus]
MVLFNCKALLTKTQWWRQFKSKREDSSQQPNIFNWRSLSPDRPPLPIFIPEFSSPSIHDSLSLDNNNIHKNAFNHSSSLLLNTTLDIPLDSLSFNKSISRKSSHRFRKQPLYPIPEESEIMTKSSTVTNNNNSSRSSSSRSSSSSSSSSSNKNENTQQPKKIPLLDSLVEEEEMLYDSSTQSSISFHPASVINDHSRKRSPRLETIPEPSMSSIEKKGNSTASTSADPFRIDISSCQLKTINIEDASRITHYPDSFKGNENLCKHELATMILTAREYRKSNLNRNEPVEMNLLFDINGNVEFMRLLRQNDRTEYHKFIGNCQFLPPELYNDPTYNAEKADIWVMGICLYLMYSGDLPFMAPTHQHMFKKMQNSNYQFKHRGFSDDLQQLIKLMLNPIPEQRASLDLISHHSWLQPYRSQLIQDNNNNNRFSGATVVNKRNSEVLSMTSSSASSKHHTNLMDFPVQRYRKSMKRFVAPNQKTKTTPLTLINPISENQSRAPEQDLPKDKMHKLKGIWKKTIKFIVHGPSPPPRRSREKLNNLGICQTTFTEYTKFYNMPN